MQLPPAVTTTQQSNEQTLARADRRHRFLRLLMDGVAACDSAVFFLRGPFNISHMWAGDETPAPHRASICSLSLFESSVHQQSFHRTSSPNVSPGIKRIAQNVCHEAL